MGMDLALLAGSSSSSIVTPSPLPLVVLVSGAAGALGSAVVLELARVGHRIFAGYNKTSEPFYPASANHPVALNLDVAQEASCRAAVDAVIAKSGRLDAVVHCAGISQDALLVHQGGVAWQNCFDINFNGPKYLDQAASRFMVPQHDGHLVHIGSSTGISGSAGQTAYATAKAALHGLTQSLAVELGPHNIRVNTVLPGILRSAMTDSLSSERLQTLRNANVLARFNDPEEVARFIAFLLSTRSISGQIFALDSRIQRLF